MSSDSITIEGRWAVEAALRSAFVRVRSVFVENDRHSDLAELIGEEVELIQLSQAEMVENTGFDFHRGVYAVADRPKPRELLKEDLVSMKRLVVPFALADGGNLGTIVRTAVAFGADGIVIARGKGTDIFSRKCIRASATGIFRVPIYEVEDLAVTLDTFRSAGGSVFGTSLEGDTTALSKVKAGDRAAIILGAEKDGFTEGIAAQCDELIHIPMRSGMDSLNVAATAAIVLHGLFGEG